MFSLTSRVVLKISFGDLKKTLAFLNRLITADISSLPENSFTFTAFLNPKGRFLFDFFLYNLNGEIFIDIAKGLEEKFLEKLKYYDLLSEVKTEETPLKVMADAHFLQNWKKGVFKGRFLTLEEVVNRKTEEEYNLERIKLCLPDGFLELPQEKAVILDYGYEGAHAISFTKGCYTGQELINRTKRMGEVRKALFCLEGKPFGAEFENLKMLSRFGDFMLILGYKAELSEQNEIILNDNSYKIISSSIA